MAYNLVKVYAKNRRKHGEVKQMQAKKEVSRASREYKYMYINDRNIRAIYIRNLNILVINTFKESKNELIFLR